MKINLFGAFREFSQEGYIQMAATDELTVSELKLQIGEALQKIEKSRFDVMGLVEKSVLATHDRILASSDMVSEETLSLLPPVCGG